MNKIKLHLGCGKRYLKGYIHVDLANYTHIEHRSDIRNLWWIASSRVDLIYTSHTISYYDRWEVPKIFREWRRVLKKGGILRVAVPDFAALAKVYGITSDVDLVNGPIYGRWKIKGNPDPIFHKRVFNYVALRNEFINAGFKNVQRWDWREVFKDYPDYDDYSQAYYPHLNKENGILISLNMEATK